VGGGSASALILAREGDGLVGSGGADGSVGGVGCVGGPPVAASIVCDMHPAWRTNRLDVMRRRSSPHATGGRPRPQQRGVPAAALAFVVGAQVAFHTEKAGAWLTAMPWRLPDANPTA